MFFADTAAMSDKNVIFSVAAGHLAEVLKAAAAVRTIHALLIRDTEASVLKLFAELQMLSSLLLIIYIRFHKSDQ